MTLQKKQDIEILVSEAKAGSREALEGIVALIQDRIYNMALRMLGHPADAEDATQEIMIRIITHLSGFRGDSALTTWAFRIAANHLLNTQKRRAEKMGFTFEVFEDAIDPNHKGAGVSPVSDPEQAVLVEEMRLSCIHGLLICLNRETRIAFILGDVFQLSGEEGSQILGISQSAFRKRVSRGRSRIRAFLIHYCGLIHPDNPCHCGQQVYGDIKRGFVNPQDLPFSGKPRTGLDQNEILSRLKDLKEMARVTLLLRSYPDYAAPEAFTEMVKAFIESGEYRLLH